MPFARGHGRARPTGRGQLAVGWWRFALPCPLAWQAVGLGLSVAGVADPSFERAECFLAGLALAGFKALRTLKLSGMLATIEARLAQARAGEPGHTGFLQVLCEDEISRRESMSMTRRLRRARFEEQVTLEGFDFTA